MSGHICVFVCGSVMTQCMSHHVQVYMGVQIKVSLDVYN